MSNELKELVLLLQEKCVIPFIGSGFSKTCGLPAWSELVNFLLDRFRIDRGEFEDKLDLLRIAEYIKIYNDGEIGPIRSEIERLFNQDSIDISRSEPHIHLVSLGAPIIYTTNFDNLIEKTFKYLKQPYAKVVTTKDIINIRGNNSTQIVKFHGSFEHEKTLVLTESDYFRRLEFESPMDIKLRADVLGKSILFMGYSFSDFNIRYLWFKLRKMMNEGMNNLDIPKSYILLTETDKVMDALFKKIGIIPIHLSDFQGQNSTERLIYFLETIVNMLHSNSNWAISTPIFATNSQINNLKYFIESGDNLSAQTNAILLSKSQFGQKQLECLISEEWIINENNMGIWFSLSEKAPSDIRKYLAEILIKLEGVYGQYCLYSILLITFLKYPSFRGFEIENEYLNINLLINGQVLHRRAEFQILFDALIWIRYSNNLKQDTTLYYLYFILLYFKDRVNEIIINPDYDAEYIDTNNIPGEYFNLTPQKVIDKIYKLAPWLPSFDFLMENSSEFDRILESLGCTLQRESDFEWNYSVEDIGIIQQLFGS